MTTRDGGGTPGVGERAQRLHDLRQPLSAILAAASALRVDPNIDAESKEKLLKIVIQNAERLAEMLDEPSASD